MNSERWQKVKGLFDVAVELAPKERKLFLDKSCGNDEELRLDVENLLDSYNDAESFMEQPAATEVASVQNSFRNLLIKPSLCRFPIVFYGGGRNMQNFGGFFNA